MQDLLMQTGAQSPGELLVMAAMFAAASALAIASVCWKDGNEFDP